MLVAVVSGFAMALLAPWLYRRVRSMAGWLIALLPLGLAIFFGWRLVGLEPGESFTTTYSWIPSLGLNLSFHADGLSLLFALIISGVGIFIVIYTGGYLADHAHVGRFYAYLMLFMAAMLGLVLADNLFLLYVFWELTSLSSFLLIGFEHSRPPARHAALQALLVTSAGGLALLAGVILLGQAGNALNFSTLLVSGAEVRAHPLYAPILLLILAGAFTKSAQMPFHFWLPNAMEAPTPVSAYLHAATMVKAGIYLLARCSPILGGTLLWQYSLTAVGSATMLIGAYLAMQQTDMKRILAYATVSALGLLTLLLGLGTTLAVQAAMTYLLVHSLYKGTLFLVAGAVDHEAGTRDITQLGGLLRHMPLTAVAAGLAALSLAGLPPLLGFIGKELVYEAALEAPFTSHLLTGVTVASSMLFVAVAAMVGFQPFLRRAMPTPHTPHEGPLSLWLGPLFLGIAGLLAVLWSEPIGTALVAPAVAAVVGHSVHVELALWHGWSFTLLLSILTVLGGVGLYAAHGVWRRTSARWRSVARWGPGQGYEWVLAAVQGVAHAQTRLLQHGYLRYYLLVIIACTTGLVGFPLVQQREMVALQEWSPVHIHEVWLTTLILAASVATLRSRTRLGMVAALGVVGYGVALLFVLFGAPDLAITQFLVETLMVILFVLVLYHLPGFTSMSSTLPRLRDLLVVLLTGCLIAALVLITLQVQWSAPISHYFAQHSLEQAHGRNIVNVILVDFRGLDTLGEITVLTVAGVGVYALLRLRLQQGKDA
jgi:multicomponent Na+:H+ antiporter subunit A